MVVNNYRMKYTELFTKSDEAGVKFPRSPAPPPPLEPTKDEKVGGDGWQPTRAVYIVFAAMCFTTLSTSLDNTSLSVSLPTIASKLNGTATEAFWAGISYLLASVVFQPSVAALSDIFGRKPLILTAITFFAVGAIVSGTANNFTIILIGRTIQGIGGGGLNTLNQILTTDLVPLRERGKFLGFISMMWSIGSVSGPLVGGIFSEKVSWRFIFFFNLPFCAIAFGGVSAFLHLRKKTAPMGQMLKKIDWIGTLIFMGAIPAILIPLTRGGIMYPWTHPATLFPLVFGFFALIAFGFYEMYIPPNPMVRLVVFNNRTAVVNYLGTTLHGMILWTMFYYLPLYYECVKGLSPIMTGVAIFPVSFTVAPTSVVAGIIISNFGKYRWAIWMGWGLTVLGIGLLTMLDVETFVLEWVYMTIAPGIGVGLLFPSMNYAIQAASSNENSAFAVGMFSFCRAFGQCFGLAIGSLIFQNTLKKQISMIPVIESLAGEYAENAVGLIKLIKDMPLSTAGRAELIRAYAESLKAVWRGALILAVFGFLASLLTRELSLDRKLETEQGMLTTETDSDKPFGDGSGSTLPGSITGSMISTIVTERSSDAPTLDVEKHGFVFTNPPTDRDYEDSARSAGEDDYENARPYVYAQPDSTDPYTFIYPGPTEPYVAAESETAGPYIDADSHTIPSPYLFEDKDAFVPALDAGRYKDPDQGFQDPSLFTYSGQFNAEAYIDSFINEDLQGHSGEPHACSDIPHAYSKPPNTRPKDSTTYVAYSKDIQAYV